MQNKLQELTDRLYNEGLSKGKQEGEAILSQAKAQAEEIIVQAKKEAEKIKADAEKEAYELKSKVAGDVKMAANQAIAATKQELETLLTGKISDEKVTAALKSPDFIKEIIKEVAKAFKAEGGAPVELSAVLPEALKKELETFVKKELTALLDGKIEATFSGRIAGGFTIGPKDGGYFISFTDETFRELIGTYLRPVTKKMLFGE